MKKSKSSANLKIILMSSLMVFIMLIVFAFTGIKNERTNSLKINTLKTSVIIVGHGGFPNDFPKMSEYFKLHDKGGEKFDKLENELIHWIRNAGNDKYWAGFMKVVSEVEKTKTYHSVHSAFNEYCAPTVDEALAEAAKTNPDVIVLTSIMMTPGGGHSEQDIPASIETFKKKNPTIKVIYAWPYEVSDIAKMLISQTNKFIPPN